MPSLSLSLRVVSLRSGRSIIRSYSIPIIRSHSTPIIRSHSTPIIRSSSRKLLPLTNPVFPQVTSFTSFARSITLTSPNMSKAAPVSCGEKATVLERLECAIFRSPEDKCSYRYVKLANNLKVVLVSDPTTDKSAAALTVQVGCMSDPWDTPGLAHFCEHMLFLGTEKFPDENCYNKFLNENCGSSNAYTSLDHTKYFFDVQPSALKEALDIFAQFFIGPLFTESCVEREVKAVDSEHSKNIQNDGWRLSQYQRSSCDVSDHCFAKFGTGNKKTLFDDTLERGVNVRDTLLDFHSKWYSANIMGLCVMGKESLDELEEMATSLFSSVVDKSVTAPSWDKHPFDVKASFSHLKSVKDIRHLHVVWPLPDLIAEYKAGAGNWVSHLLGHEGPGSLLSQLKKDGLATQLCAGYSRHARGFGFFELQAYLTEEGLERVDDVLLSVFQYIEVVKATDPEEWMFQECKELSAIEFRFKSKSQPINYTARLSSSALNYPPEDIVSADQILTEFSPEKIKAVQNALVPDSVKVYVVSQNHESECVETEKWYGTKYCVRPLTEEQLSKLRSPGVNPALVLPKPNEFIAQDFSLCMKEPVSKFPVVILDEPLAKVWFKQDDYFELPKNTVCLSVTSPGVYIDPHRGNLCRLYADILNDNLNEFAYDAELAGIKYDVANSMTGVTIQVCGFHHKQDKVLAAITEKMLKFSVDPRRFEMLKDSYARSLKNSMTSAQPYVDASAHSTVIMFDLSYSKEQLLEQFDFLTVPEIEKFAARFLESMHVEALIHGPIESSRALELVNIMLQPLKNHKTRPVQAVIRRKRREHEIPKGGVFSYNANNTVHDNSSVLLLLQTGAMNTSDNTLLQLVVQVVQEPSFDELRTKEALGYIVFTGTRRSSGTQSLRVIIQSPYKPEYLESRIEAFLAKMEQYIVDMNEEDFITHRSALIKQRLEKSKTQTHLTAVWWSEVIGNSHNFDRDVVETDYLATVTKEQLLAYYKHHISPTSPHRAKLVVRVSGTEPKEGPGGVSEPPAALAEEKVITDVANIKATWSLLPSPTPYVAPPEAATVGTATSEAASNDTATGAKL